MPRETPGRASAEPPVQCSTSPPPGLRLDSAAQLTSSGTAETGLGIRGPAFPALPCPDSDLRKSLAAPVPQLLPRVQLSHL